MQGRHDRSGRSRRAEEQKSRRAEEQKQQKKGTCVTHTVLFLKTLRLHIIVEEPSISQDLTLSLVDWRAVAWRVVHNVNRCAVAIGSVLIERCAVDDIARVVVRSATELKI